MEKPSHISTGLLGAYATILVHGLVDVTLWNARSALLFWIVAGMVSGYFVVAKTYKT